MSNAYYTLEAAKAGLPVFPCKPDKSPYTPNGFKDATTDLETIRAWWEKWPNALIGMPTGRVSGVWVLDIDAPKDGETANGYDSLKELDAKHGELPKTRRQKTAGGGMHYFFWYPKDGLEIRNSTSKLAPKIDVRGEGGYIIIAPSVLPDGRCYELIDAYPVLEAPDWLLDLVCSKEHIKEQESHQLQTVSSISPYVQAAIDGELQKLASATIGTRNDSLNRAAFALGQWVGAGVLSYEEACKLLLNAAQQCGLVVDDGKNSVNKTIASGLKAGMQEPRQIPQSFPDNDQGTGEDGEQESHTLPPPPPVPMEAFPPIIQAMMEEACAAFTVPMQIVAANFLAFLSCLVGRSRLISIKSGWEEAGNLWIASVASSGMGKSPCMNAFFRPITYLEHEAKQDFDKAYNVYETELAAYEVQRKLQIKEKAKGKEIDTTTLCKPKEPKLRQATADDATVEALGNILKKNPKGILWVSDELRVILSSFGKYTKDSGDGTKERLLSAYGLGWWIISRSSNPDRNIFIPKACVGIFGGIQPGIMSKAFKAGEGGIDEESGFLPRFLFVRAVAENPAYWTDNIFSRDSIALLERIAVHLWKWDIEYDAQGREIDMIAPVCHEAKELYVEWYNAIAEEAFLAENSALLRKLQAHALRICLLLHSLDAALSGTDGMTPVKEDTMRRALILADWAKEHQKQCWRLFTPKKGGKQATPIERAIMQVVLDEAAHIEHDGWRIKSGHLIGLVRKKLDMSGISDKKIGKAATALGLGSCYLDKDRARSVTQDQIASFKASVGPVAPVNSLTPARVSGTTDTDVERLLSVDFNNILDDLEI